MTPTDTPDVDAAAFEEHGLPGSLVVHIDFARRIRREANEQKLEVFFLQGELKDAKAKIESNAVQYAEAQKLLEKQKTYLLDVQKVLSALVNEQEWPAVPNAGGELNGAKSFRAHIAAQTKSVGDRHAAIVKEWEQRYAASEKSARDAAEASTKQIAALEQQLSDLQLRLAATEELNFELAANVGKLAERIPSDDIAKELP